MNNKLVGKIGQVGDMGGRVGNQHLNINVNMVESGARGKSLEFLVEGDMLGVRVEGEVDYEWVTLTPRDYELLKNKPTIETVELTGNISLEQIGVDLMTPQDIDNLF